MSKRLVPGVEYPKVNENGDLQVNADITLQEYMKYFGDRTLITGGAISDNGNGTAAVASGTAWCKVTDADVAIGKLFAFSTDSSVSLTDLITNFVYVDYNDGVPQIVVATSIITYGFKQDHIFVGAVFRNGNTLHYHQTDNLGIGRMGVVHMHHAEETPVHRATGMVTTDGGSLALAVSTGVLYGGLNRHPTTADGSSWSYWYTSDSGSTWVEDTGQSVLVQSYNDITSGKVALTSNRFGVHWVYMDNDGTHIHVVYGQGDYTANLAEEAGVPSVLPPIVTGYCVLIAKIINQEGTNTLTILYPWSTMFTSSLATDHGSLGGLGDDDHTQYIKHSLATAVSDFLAASGSGAYVKKTKAEVLTILGKAAASGLASLNASTKVVQQPASITDHLEGTPTEDLATKAPTSEWAFDHAAATTGVHGLALGARVYHDADQEIATGTPTTLAFNQERKDTDTIHDNSTNNSRLTCKTAGTYAITFSGNWEPVAGGRRVFNIMLTRPPAAAVIVCAFTMSPDAGNYAQAAKATICEMAIEDYVEIQAYHTQGAALDVDSNAEYSPEFSMQRIG